MTLMMAVTAVAGPRAQESIAPELTSALQRAVRDRLDSRAEVRVSDVRVQWTGTRPDGALRAKLEPNQRLGRPLRFLVYEEAPGANHRARAAAQATVRVRMPVVRVSRAVPRGAIIAGSDVVEVWDEPAARVGSRLPLLSQVVGAQATRDLAVGAIVTAPTVRRLPIVRPGDELVARASVGGIEVTGKAIARQAGRLGQVIRVVNPDSGRRLHARVIGPREVEVEHVR